MTDSLDRYQFKINEESKEIIFRHDSNSRSKRFSYTFINPNFLELKGTLDGDSIVIQFKRKPITDFKLMNRKFHWVNEKANNR
jgi:hypothetical protein